MQIKLNTTLDMYMRPSSLIIQGQRVDESQIDTLFNDTQPDYQIVDKTQIDQLFPNTTRVSEELIDTLFVED